MGGVWDQMDSPRTSWVVALFIEVVVIMQKARIPAADIYAILVDVEAVHRIISEARLFAVHDLRLFSLFSRRKNAKRLEDITAAVILVVMLQQITVFHTRHSFASRIILAYRTRAPDSSEKNPLFGFSSFPCFAKILLRNCRGRSPLRICSSLAQRGISQEMFCGVIRAMNPSCQ